MEDWNKVPRGLRGIYALHKKEGARAYKTVYVGRSTAPKTERGGIRGRINRHRKSKEKDFTHFSVLEVWDNIGDEEIAELEGIILHIYQLDSKASPLNAQRSFGKLGKVKRIFS
ncbi:MAG: GIY-YIG nuclease family protein [Gammaproteobacteria bacterium]